MLRFTGQPPVQVTVYELEKLRCGLCGEVFTAKLPEGAGLDKYDPSVAGMIALGTIVLQRDPAYAKLVREGSPEDVDRVVEELLRYLAVVQVAFPRFAKQDMELFGTQVKAGDVILASLTGANRDPAAAGHDPEVFNPHRVPTSGHLAFGHGIHQCIGQHLARIEMRVGYSALFRRFPGLRPAVPAEELPLRTDMFIYGMHRFPVTW